MAVTATGVLAGKTVVAIAAGGSHSMALCADGTVAAWGSNTYGRLGNNSTTDSSVPVAVDATGVLAGKTVVAIAAGGYHSMALCEDGTVAAWGRNFSGQLGNNSATDSSVPVAVTATGVLAGKTVVAVAAGGYHSMALCADSTVAAWGSNGNGQLGNNSTTDSTVPAVVTATGALAGKTVVAIAAGSYHSMALCSDGTVAAWGRNFSGQLGNNSATDSSVPVTVNTTGVLAGKTVGAIAAGGYHSMALCTDGTVSTWGTNGEGELGNNSTTSSSVPVAVNTSLLTAGERFSKLFGGGAAAYHSLALASVPRSEPAVVTPTSTNLTASSVTLGGNVTNDGGGAITERGVIYSATAINNNPIIGGTGVTKVTTSGTTGVFTVPVSGLSEGTIYSFKAYATNAAGTAYTSAGTFSTSVSNLTATFTAATDVPLTLPAVRLTGGTATLALGFAPAPGTELTVVKNTGIAFIGSAFGNLWHGKTVSLSYGGVTYGFVANYYGGSGNDLVLEWKNNRALAWGYNVAGQLGNNSTTSSSVPVAVDATGVLAGRTVIAVAAGAYHSLALRSDGTVVAWGSNSSGELGNNSTTASSVPVAVNAANSWDLLNNKTVVAIAVGQYHSLALTSDGKVAAWGYNGSGQLGDDYSTTESYVPEAVRATGVLADKTVVAIAAGGSHSVALCADGTVATWGSNTYGQLGNNSTADSGVPVAVMATGVLAGKTVVAIAAGHSHSMALCIDGTVATWGYNGAGQLGNNSATDSSVPVLVNVTGVLAGKTAVAIAAGGYHSLALCSDGTVTDWGNNGAGQLGNNSTTASSLPVAVNATGVLAGKTVVTIAAAGFNSAALCSDGTMAAWGDNYAGVLGDGSTTNRLVPVAVNSSMLTAGVRFSALFVGSDANHSLALASGPPLTVTTPTSTGVAASAATLGGNVTSDGGAAITERGVVYSATATNNDPIIGGTGVTKVTTTGTTGVFTVGVAGLSAVTSYSFKAYATNSLGTYYTIAGTFTTPTGPPTVTTPTSADITASTTTLGGHVTSDGAVLITERGVVYSATATNNNPTIGGTGVTKVTTSGMTGVFTVPITGLSATTSYSFKAYATNGSGTSYTEVAIFVTAVNQLTATYTAATDVPLTLPAVRLGGTATLTLGFAPAVGTELTVVKNIGLDFISGNFSNLVQGQTVPLSFNGVTYEFLVNHYGGSGNDLVLVWKNNRALAWGRNANGQLGNNSTTQSLVPVALDTTGVLAGKTVIAVAAGLNHSLALCIDGTVAAWGDNGSGQLGNNSTIDSIVPVAVDVTGVLAGKTVVAVAAGAAHSMALCSDGTVAAWGMGFYGQLGNNSTTDSSVPVEVVASGALAGKTAVAVAAGRFHSLALCSDGTVAAWGYNGKGELGNNSTTDSSVPVEVNATGVLAGKTVIAAKAGFNHSMALCSDGTVATWGYNIYGQLGNNSTADSLVPVAVTTTGGLAGKTVVAVAAGISYSLALCTDGTVVAWGYNIYGQLGNDSTTNSKVPVAVTAAGVLAGKTVVTIAAGGFHGMALCSDGTMTSWGRNNYGQLGSNSTTQSNVPVAVNSAALNPGERFSSLFVGPAANHSLAVAAAPLSAPTVTAPTSAGMTASAASLGGMVTSDGGSVITERGVVYSPTATNNDPTIGGAGVTKATTSGTTGIFFTDVSELNAGTGYTFKAYATNSVGTSYSSVSTFATLTLQQGWRQQYFGITGNSGDAADDFDYDKDGLANLIEWACNLNPTTPSVLSTPLERIGATIEYTYTRSVAAVNAGAIFTVEWSDTLLGGSWSGTGVTQQILSDNGTVQQVKATLPTGSNDRRFVHLVVSPP